MFKRGARLFIIILSILMFFCISNLVYAKNGNDKNGNKYQTKNVLVKYRDKDSKREAKLKNDKSMQKLKNYKKINKGNLYSIELEDSEIKSLQNDSDIEIIEEDAVTQLLCEDNTTCSGVNHGIINHDIHSFSEESEEVEESEDNAEQVHTKQNLQDKYWHEGLCIICFQPACNEGEECLDKSHFYCNACFREVLYESDSNVASCPCECQKEECTYHELCDDAKCNFDCITSSFNVSQKPLETGINSATSPLGDKIYWNILRTKSILLHEKNIKGSGIKVAIFDTGIDLNYNELNVVGGVSFVEGVTSYNDDNGHGTAMAGILAARLNGQGMVGIAPEVDLYAVKVLDKDGIGRYSYVIQGIEWAIENNINIISLSLGGNQYSQILEEAINLAIESNILIVAAAGNGGQDNIMYPAAYPQVICVGATDSDNKLATFSNYGSQLDIVAPGKSIVTTGLNNTEVMVNGTSPATQHVAGVAALLWSADRNLTNGHIKYLLYRNAFSLGDYNLYGHGFIDSELSLHNLENNDYSIYIEDENGGFFIDELVDVGWDGVVYGQACKHSWKFIKIVSPKCVFDGYDYYECTKCGAWKEENIVPSLGHDFYETGRTQPKCTKDGKINYLCRRCDFEKVGTIPMLDHDYSIIDYIKATCTTRGYTRYTCSRCSTTYHDDYYGPEHNWVYHYTISPTCQKEGAYVFYCSNCSATDSYPIPKTSCNYSYYVSPAHTSSGHYWSTGCSYCGSGGSYGYTTLSNCLSCTTAPSISFANMSGNTVLCETDTNFIPQIKVFDNENDTLTCKYYLDGNTTAAGTITVTGTKPEKTVAFTTGFNAANLNEGNHTIKATAKDNVAPMGETTLIFKVDKSAPNISNLVVTPTANNVKFTVTASDSIAGLASAAYRYTVNGVATEWLSSGTYTKADLIPNTSYSYKVEVRDDKGHIASQTGSFSTNVESPVVSATALHENNIQIVISDNNPANTQYLIMVGNGYVSSGGTIVSSESWITIPYDANVNGKRIVLTNLYPGTSYMVMVSARNISATEIVTASSVSVVTSPAAPTGIVVASVTYEQISLQWQTVSGAVQYEIFRETIDGQGNLIEAHTKTISANYLYDNNLLPEQDYVYYIRSINQNGIYGVWSSPIQVKTLSALPEKVTGISADINGTVLTLSWNEIIDVVGYKIEVVYDGNVETLYSKDNHITFDTMLFNCQCDIRVKAYNRCDENEPDNTDLWTNEGEWSEPVLIYTSADIPIISLVPDSVTPNSVTVSWDVKQNPESVRYLLNISDGINTVEIPVVGTTAINGKVTYLVTGLKPETSYGFKVKAINTVDMDTEWSNQVNAVTLMDYPAVPDRLRATAKSDRISLFWDPAYNAQSYILEKDGIILVENWQETSYVDTNVLPDTDYTYRVKAVNTTGESDWSLNLNKRTLGNVPVSPTITFVTGSSINVIVEWESSEPVSGYEIEADGQIYNVGLNTMFEHNGLVPGTTHVYAVRSRNIYGRSEWSNFVTYTTSNLIPDIPSILQVIPSREQISVLWSAVSGAKHYEIELDGIIIGSSTSLGYQIFMNENDSGPDHTLRIRAVNESGEGGWTAPYPVIIPDEGSIPDIPIPTTPLLVSNVTGSTTVILEWKLVDDASYYQLEADNNIVYTGTDTVYIHTGNLPNSNHTYRVRAGNLSGLSQWSEPVIATTDMQYDTTPKNISYFRIDDFKTQIVWDQVININDYIVKVNNTVSGSAITGNSIIIPTEPGELYNVQVASVVNEDGTEYLDWSDEITFRTPRKLPGIPQNINFIATSDSITVTWDEVIDARGYEVVSYRGYHDVGNSTSLVLTGLDSSSSYKIQLRAYNEAGAGEWSEIFNISTLDEISGVPANILCYSYHSEDNSRGSTIIIQWDNVRRAISYEVEDKNGNIYETDTNEIIIGDLNAGTTYKFRVRAISKNAPGAWSNWIYVMPVVEKPGDVTASMHEDKIQVAWKRVALNDFYEIEIDGVSVETTENLSHDFDYPIFYLERRIRVRAIRDNTKGLWSDEVEFGQPLPINVSVYDGEEFSVLLPAMNVELGSHKITLTYKADEVELIDACEITANADISNCFIEELKTHVMIENNGGMVSITFLVDDSAGISYSGIISSIRFRSKITGDVTLHYGVTLR